MYKMTALAIALCLTGCTKDSGDKSSDTDIINTANAATVKDKAPAAARVEALPSLEHVLAKHFKALGGEDNLRNAKTLTYSGTYTHGDKTATIAKFYERAGNKFRVEKDKGDETMIKVVNGDKAWQLHDGKVEEMTGEKAQYAMKGASMDDELLTYKQDGSAVKLVGKGNVDGKPAFQIEIAKGEHKTEMRYIDAGSFLEVKRVVSWQKEGKSGKTTIKFSDYRDVGDGMMINHRADYQSDEGPGVFIIDSAAYNAPIDAARFEPPAVQ